jgi:hypothetical protein
MKSNIKVWMMEEIPRSLLLRSDFFQRLDDEYLNGNKKKKKERKKERKILKELDWKTF